MTERNASEASRLVVIEGTGYDAKKRSNNRVLVTETDAGAIAEIQSLLEPGSSSERVHWMEWPTASVVLLADRTPLLEVRLLSGAEWAWVDDSGCYAVTDPQRVRLWLAARGYEIADDPLRRSTGEG